MFIGRRQDGTIYGTWTVKQWDGQEELADNHSDIIAFNTPDPKVAIQKQMDELEQKAIAPRWLRETLMPLAVEKAVALGYTEPQLYASNIAYRKIKDLDILITSLRDQMVAL